MSLDDFLRGFLGQRDTGPVVAPYSREDVETSLASICNFDWHSFFETRIYKVNPKPPIEGLEAAGWRLVYNETPDKETFISTLTDSPAYFATYSIGIELKKDGTILDVLPGSPAYGAGLGPQMTILAVDGRIYSQDALNESIDHPKDGKIELVIRNFDSVETRQIQYAGRLRYPHLERIPETRDYLSEILQPKASRK